MTTETTYSLIGANWSARAKALKRIREQSGTWHADGGQTSRQVHVEKEYSAPGRALLSTRRIERVFLLGKFVHEVEL
jgi:hypothetical protein